jgi:S1-C subfamily serine protease
VTLYMRTTWSGDAQPIRSRKTKFMETSNAFYELSQRVADAAEYAAPAVVAIDSARTGSGGIIWGTGIVVTSDDELPEADEVELTFADGSSTAGTIVGRDETTDIAVVRYTGNYSATAARREESERLRVGELTLALGRDDDNDLSATMGVVAMTGPAWHTWGGGTIDAFIRPDIWVYRRFCGGPLVDASGRVVGMNTTALSRRTAVTIPVATLDRVVNQLVATGRIPRGYLGVAMQPVRGGVIVLSVELDGPANKAGVIVGDVINAIGDTEVEDTDDVQRALGPDTVGRAISLRIIRGGEKRNVSVTVGERQ